MKKVLVTGGFGRVGKHVVETLLKDGYSVRIFDRKDTGAFKGKAEIFIGDLLKYDDVKNAVKGVDIVCHLAAVFPPFFFEEFTIFDVNVKGTFHVLQAIKEVGNIQKLVFASTDAVYATGSEYNPYDVPIKENMEAWPVNVYAICKYSTEIMIQKYSRLFNIPYVNLRIFWAMDSKEMIGLLFKAGNYMDNILAEDKVGLNPDDIVAPMQADGKIFHEHFCESRDVAQGFVLGIEREDVKNETFNLAAPDRLDYTKYYELIGKKLGKPFRKVRVKGIKDYEADISRTKSILGYKPVFTVEKMINEALTHNAQTK
ncbi:MAG: NAD(P)-dependent oxidoreductase [Lentisphaerota bacterium]